MRDEKYDCGEYGQLTQAQIARYRKGVREETQTISRDEARGLTMIPKCYNRPDFGNYLVQDGWEPGVTPAGTPTRYPVMVEVPFVMSQGCKSWAADKASDPVPLMEGWECKGCRHYPAADVRAAIKNSRIRNAKVE